jgi:2-polyprenyl-3-methyl-5-hydroxy-6-metoxy-1,4-benzoquinol methylase
MFNQTEKEIQESFTWQRSKEFPTYNPILGKYQALACIDVAAGESVLDLPCGDGTLTEIFSRNFKKVVGVDASSKHLFEARKRLPNVEFYESLIEEFAPKEKFDSIFMLNILEHLDDPVSVLQKVSSWLNPGGVIVVQVPNADAINRRINLLMGSINSCDELSPFDINVAGHRRYYRMSSLVDDIQKAGLKVKSTGGVFYKMLSTVQMDWLLSQKQWDSAGFGWGRDGAENEKDWRAAFCEACYRLGKERPEDCNIIYACITL